MKTSTAAFTLLSLTSGILCCQVAQAQVAPTVSKSSTASAKADLAKKEDARKMQQRVNRILQETSKMRQLKVKRTVPSGVISRASIERLLKSSPQDKQTSKQLLAAEIFLKQLGLAPANFNLRDTYIGMMSEQIAGFYDLRTKKFYTTDTVDSLQVETVMAHELTHALQDQNFDLSRIKKWPDHDSDAELAMLSLMEGDATYTMSRYMMSSPLRAMGAIASSFKPQKPSPIFKGSPRILRDSIIFPYTKGMVFASNLYKIGGWSQLSTAFECRPLSTEQILHIEKYMEYEAPVEVKLRDLTPVLGKGWSLLDHDVNGEIGLSLTVGEFLNDDARAERAAAGWGGDRLSIYRGPRDAALVVQDCVWDSVAEAREWREAYAKRSTVRFKMKPTQRGGLQIWNAAPKGVWMEQRGKRVLILEGKVGAFNPQPVFFALWR